MEMKNFKKEAKILMTDLAAGRSPEENRKKYIAMLAAGYSSYSAVKATLNACTGWEKEDRIADPDEELLRKILLAYGEGKEISEEEKEELMALRDKGTRQVEAITAYVDHLSMHESVLNRILAGMAGDASGIKPDTMVRNLEHFLFMDKDRVVVNTRIQQVVRLLPVRMTKQRFYDILTESFALYKGGELSAAEDFASSIRDVAGITVPDDEALAAFPDILQQLRDTRKHLEGLDHQNLTKEAAEEAGEMIQAAADLMDQLSTELLLRQEIINDLLVLLLTRPYLGQEYLAEEFTDALKLMCEVAKGESPENFSRLEGVQESTYENLLILTHDLDALAKDLPEKTGKDLRTADLLLSSSLFINLEKMVVQADGERIMADEASIQKLIEALFADFDRLFTGMNRTLKRGTMGNVLGHVPVFFNSREETVGYIRYTLDQCNDPAEYSAVCDMLKELMEE